MREPAAHGQRYGLSCPSLPNPRCEGDCVNVLRGVWGRVRSTATPRARGLDRQGREQAAGPVPVVVVRAALVRAGAQRQQRPQVREARTTTASSSR